MRRLSKHADAGSTQFTGILSAIYRSRHCRRNLATLAKDTERDLNEMEPLSIPEQDPENELVQSFNPLARSRGRKRQLPPSRLDTCSLIYEDFT